MTGWLAPVLTGMHRLHDRGAYNLDDVPLPRCPPKLRTLPWTLPGIANIPPLLVATAQCNMEQLAERYITASSLVGRIRALMQVCRLTETREQRKMM